MAKKSSASEEEIIKKYSSTVYKIAYSVTSSRADNDDIFIAQMWGFSSCYQKIPRTFLLKIFA